MCVYIYIKRPIVKQTSFTPTCSAMEDLSPYILKNYCEANTLY